jgi:hypothetical protein
MYEKNIGLLFYLLTFSKEKELRYSDIDRRQYVLTGFKIGGVSGIALNHIKYKFLHM